MAKAKRTVLIFEDAAGVARKYAELLEDEYHIVTCASGKELMALLDRGRIFDAAIMDIVAPPETDQHSLEDSKETGLRLIKRLISKKACNRFYVITVRADLKKKLSQICAGSAVLFFESKRTHEPAKFNGRVADLLGKSRPSGGGS